MSRNQNDVLVTTAPTSTNTASASSNVETSQITNAANASSVPEQLTQTFSCSNPVNPPMRSESARLQTHSEIDQMNGQLIESQLHLTKWHKLDFII